MLRWKTTNNNHLTIWMILEMHEECEIPISVFVTNAFPVAQAVRSSQFCPFSSDAGPSCLEVHWGVWTFQNDWIWKAWDFQARRRRPGQRPGLSSELCGLPAGVDGRAKGLVTLNDLSFYIDLWNVVVAAGNSYQFVISEMWWWFVVIVTAWNFNNFIPVNWNESKLYEGKALRGACRQITEGLGRVAWSWFSYGRNGKINLAGGNFNTPHKGFPMTNDDHAQYKELINPGTHHGRSFSPMRRLSRA